MSSGVPSSTWSWVPSAGAVVGLLADRRRGPDIAELEVLERALVPPVLDRAVGRGADDQQRDDDADPDDPVAAGPLAGLLLGHHLVDEGLALGLHRSWWSWPRRGSSEVREQVGCRRTTTGDRGGSLRNRWSPPVPDTGIPDRHAFPAAREGQRGDPRVVGRGDLARGVEGGATVAVEHPVEQVDELLGGRRGTEADPVGRVPGQGAGDRLARAVAEQVAGVGPDQGRRPRVRRRRPAAPGGRARGRARTGGR